MDGYGLPKVVNDGGTIARAIELLDTMEKPSSALIREPESLNCTGCKQHKWLIWWLYYNLVNSAREFIKRGLLSVTSGSNLVSIKQGIDHKMVLGLMTIFIEQINDDFSKKYNYQKTNITIINSLNKNFGLGGSSFWSWYLHRTL